MKKVTIYLKENTYREIEKVFEETKKELGDFDKNELYQYLLDVGLESWEDLYCETFFPNTLYSSKGAEMGFIHKVKNSLRQTKPEPLE